MRGPLDLTGRDIGSELKRSVWHARLFAPRLQIDITTQLNTSIVKLSAYHC